MSILYVVLVVAVMCCSAQAVGYVSNVYYSGLSCTGSIKNITVFSNNTCIRQGATTNYQIYSCVGNTATVRTCSTNNCTTSTCGAATTYLPCSNSAGGGSLKINCSSSLPSYPTFVKKGIFSSSNCTVSSLNSYTYYNSTYCMPNGNEPTKFICKSNAIAQYDCYDSACSSCDSTVTWYPYSIACALSNSAYVNYTCVV